MDKRNKIDSYTRPILVPYMQSTTKLHTENLQKKTKHCSLFFCSLCNGTQLFFKTAGADINAHLKVRSRYTVRFKELLLVVI